MEFRDQRSIAGSGRFDFASQRQIRSASKFVATELNGAARAYAAD